jgi:peptide/nickel transport system substrate-binding protein
MNDIPRRSVLGGAVAVAAASLFTGTQALAQNRRVLVIASQSDITNFDPHVSADDPSSMLMRNTYDALLGFEGEPPKLTPNLAASWTFQEAANEYVFKLNPAAKFHDGSPVTADAVKYSFERLLRINKGNVYMIAGIVEPGNVQAVDANTVRIKLSKQFAPFLQVLPWVAIVNPKLVEENKGADDGQTYLRSTIAGSGPFRIRRAEAGNLVEFERVTDGWKKGGGNLSGVIWKIVRETGNQRLMIQRGESHIAVNLTSDDMTALKDRPGAVLVIKPEFRNFLFRMNNKRGPLADVNLRKAISYAVDYKGMLDVGGYAQPSGGPLADGMFGFDPGLAVYKTDLAKAKEFLAKTPFAQGGKLVVVHISGNEQQRRWCLVLLDSLKNIGIELEIKPLNWPDMVAQMRTPETCPDMISLYTASNYADPADSSFNNYHSSRLGNYTNPTYSSAAVDNLLTQGRIETNLAKRKQLYLDFQKAIMADAPDIFVVSDLRKIALRSNVSGFNYTPIRPPVIDLFPLSIT